MATASSPLPMSSRKKGGIPLILATVIGDTENMLKTLRFLVSAETEIPWYTTYTYEGHTCKRQDGGYLIILRAKRANGERVVTFYGARHTFDAWWLLASDLSRGRVKWSTDKYNQLLRE